MVLKYYQKRIVHINLNILIASIIATLIASYPIYIISFLIDSKFDSKIVFILLAFLIDGIIDFTIFGILHSVVHYIHLKKGLALEVFFKDLAIIQGQRMILSVLFFILAVSGHYILIELGLGYTRSYLISYISSILIIRAIHTIYGLKTGLFNDLK